MKFTFPLRMHLPTRLVRIVAIAGTLLSVLVLLVWGVWFLRREAQRITMPVGHGVDIPVLDRALLSEFAARVPK